MGRGVRIDFRTLFSLHGTIDRRTYLVTGLGLMAAKYIVDAAVIWSTAHIIWTPWDYMLPLLSIKTALVVQIPSSVSFLLLIWTLPFIWIGVSMMMRRAVDAGRSPAWCATFFIPFLNYAAMLWLATLPSVPLTPESLHYEHETAAERYRSAIIGAAGALIIGVMAMLISVFALRTYGITLFVATPFLQGVVVGWAFNRQTVKPDGQTSSVVILSVLLVGGALALFALEGLVCIAMAFPVALLVAILGGIVGRQIAIVGGNGGAGIAAALFVLPSGALIERATTAPPTYEAVTAVDVAAPASTVWRHVVQFKTIEDLPSWYFRLGIAYPISASINGSGVGAIRRCEFSTGAFVEPITAWDEPSRLAFDVVAQPPPMRELSPYSKVYAPHIDGFFRSSHGEFRLIPTASGTRLEGHTWYSVAIYPQAYWRALSELLLHRIHQRVLDQVKREAESEISPGGSKPLG
ncbi:MAG TPA: SRPBCC family protein [Gemmatimonadaceae bacterium]|nr:SRPBCC family protein [Gemmatimonadaceae bacterium]